MSSSVEAVKLTEGEAEQYDRQIRLWGLEAQKRQVLTSVLWGYPFCGSSGFLPRRDFWAAKLFDMIRDYQVIIVA